MAVCRYLLSYANTNIHVHKEIYCNTYQILCLKNELNKTRVFIVLHNSFITLFCALCNVLAFGCYGISGTKQAVLKLNYPILNY